MTVFSPSTLTGQITTAGLVATTPRQVTIDDLMITSFRLAVTSRVYDRKTAAWLDGDTSWYTVVATGALGENVGRSLNRGDRVIVVGTIRIHDVVGLPGQHVELTAHSIGHDLQFGRSTYARATIAEKLQAASAAPNE